MKVDFALITSDRVVIYKFVLYFNPQQPFPPHEFNDNLKVEAPNEDYDKDEDHGEKNVVVIDKDSICIISLKFVNF